MVCGRCKCVAYCSVVCQKQHYTNHKTFCRHKHDETTKAANKTAMNNKQYTMGKRREECQNQTYKMIVVPPSYIILDDGSYQSYYKLLLNGMECAVVDEVGMQEDVVLRKDGKLYGQTSGRLVVSYELHETYKLMGKDHQSVIAAI